MSSSESSAGKQPLAAAILIEAKARRDREIAVLQACTCGFPVRRSRHFHGHADDCPGAVVWKMQRDALVASSPKIRPPGRCPACDEHHRLKGDL